MHLSDHCQRRLNRLALAIAVAVAAAACGSSHPGTGIRAATALGATRPHASPIAASPSAAAITPAAAADPVRSGHTAPASTQQAAVPPTAAAGAVPAQERQIAVAVLSGFKVVLTATRSPGQSAGPAASVSAAGYENTAHGWNLIAVKTIGSPNQWFWYSVSVCALTVTQLTPKPSSAATSDTITVTMMMTPALGCSGAITEDFGPGA
jgi:hypothetical protein